MAEPLKNQYGPKIPRTIARMIAAVHPAFPTESFLHDALDGYEALELKPRGQHIAEALHRHLPTDFPQAVDILLASLDEPLAATEGHGMAPFLYMPHTMFVATHGLNHFEVSMQAQYELTQRFTAEFSIRAFLEHHPDATLARLRQWTQDPSEHVRRLVSEGTRPRLPWASRLRMFQQDPRPVLELLELLKDDPSLYVRRSVANNLNDIGKDHPALLVDTARAWMHEASEERQWLIRHALRTAVKRGDADALAVLGYGSSEHLDVKDVRLTPAQATIGGKVTIAFTVVNTHLASQRVMVDFQVHFVKANGSTRPKVFKLSALELAPQEQRTLQKTIWVSNMSTRTHYPGAHRVDALLNGRAVPLGAFELSATT